MFRAYDQKQAFLLPPSLSDFLDESHPAHVINDIVERLDLARLENRYGHIKVLPVCTTGREGKDEKARTLDAMNYDGGEDRFICQHGQAFEFDRERPKDGMRIYRSLSVVGCGCSQYGGAGIRAQTSTHLRSLRQWVVAMALHDAPMPQHA